LSYRPVFFACRRAPGGVVRFARFPSNYTSGCPAVNRKLSRRHLPACRQNGGAAGRGCIEAPPTIILPISL